MLVRKVQAGDAIVIGDTTVLHIKAIRAPEGADQSMRLAIAADPDVKILHARAGEIVFDGDGREKI